MAVEIDDVDVATMLRLQNGDDCALNEIMERWQKRVLGYLTRLTGNLTIASDLAEETFVQLYQSRSRYRHKGTFSTWLFAIATNLYRNQARWQHRHSTVSMDGVNNSDGSPLSEKLFESRPNPDEKIEIAEKAMAVKNAGLSLPEDQRQAILLFEYEGLSHEEIAQVVKCTPKAVEARLYRARGVLRVKLKKLLE